jgi:uncharacterized protein (DUF433 family)
MNIVQSIDCIVKNPDVRGGRPHIVGTTLRVTDLVMAHLFHQRTADEIASDYELSLAQVYAALAYYYEHKAELDEDIRAQITAAHNVKAKLANGRPSFLSR